MYSPPPYTGTGKRKSNVGLIIGIVVACVCLCCLLPLGYVGVMGMNVFKNSGGMVGCSANMESTRAAVVAYARKNGGKFPEAVDWRKDIAPYLKAPAMPPNAQNMFKVAPITSGICDSTVQSVISYNSEAAGKKLSDLEEKETVVLFETPAGSPNSAPYKEQAYRSSPTLVANAHRGWLEINATGSAYIVGPNGAHSPVGSPTTHRSGVQIETSATGGSSGD